MATSVFMNARIMKLNKKKENEIIPTGENVRRISIQK